MADRYLDGDSKIPEPEEQLGLFSSLLGLVLQPRATVEALLSEPVPRNVLGLLSLLLIAIFVPVISIVWRDPSPAQHMPAVLSLLALVTVTLGLLFILESWVVIILKVEAPPARILACIGYSIGPLVFMILLVYFFNFLVSGELTLVHLLLDTSNAPPVAFMRLIPWAVLLAVVLALIVFFYAIRAAGQLGSFSALLVTIVAIFPFLIAFGAGLMVADRIRPGTVELVSEVIFKPGGVISQNPGLRLRQFLPLERFTE